MKEAESKAESKLEQIKNKMDLDDIDLGIDTPSLDVNEYIRVLKLARSRAGKSSP
jgi:hypothetical protein